MDTAMHLFNAAFHQFLFSLMHPEFIALHFSPNLKGGGQFQNIQSSWVSTQSQPSQPWITRYQTRGRAENCSKGVHYKPLLTYDGSSQ